MTDALIRRLKAAVRSGRWVEVAFASQPRVPPPPPANPGVVAAAEAEVGFRLPDLLRRMYLEVANGGFGPFYGLLGLDGGATEDLGYNALDQWFNARQDLAAPRRRKPLPELALFPCFYAGCNEYSCLDCRNPDGPMWRYDLSRRPARFEPEGFTLAGLMERWAAGPTSAESLARRRKATRKETLMSEKKAPGKLAHAKGTQKSAKSTPKQAAKKAAPRPGPRADKADGESAVLAKIAAMPEPDRAMGERLHAIIKASAPVLSPKLWYGMPAYAKDGKVVCFFRDTQKFKERYMTLGFNEEANLDEGALWPIAFALKELTAAEEARIGALVKKAVS